MKTITAEQLKNEILTEKAEIIAEAKAKGYYYPELETGGIYSDENSESYRTIGSLDYYFLKCEQLGIKPKTIASGLHYEAQGAGFTLEYCERDVILCIDKLLTFEQIKATGTDGARYWAISENWRKYSATYSTEHFGGTLFFCIPSDVKIIGYKERSIKTFTTKMRENYTGGDLLHEYAKANGYELDITRFFQTVVTIDGKRYEYDRIAKNEDGESMTVTIAEVA